MLSEDDGFSIFLIVVILMGLGFAWMTDHEKKPVKACCQCIQKDKKLCGENH